MKKHYYKLLIFDNKRTRKIWMDLDFEIDFESQIQALFDNPFESQCQSNRKICQNYDRFLGNSACIPIMPFDTELGFPHAFFWQIRPFGQSISLLH